MPRLRLAPFAALVAAAIPATAQAVPSYVALGDSYTSGPLIPQQRGRPVDCARSDRNYPSLTAAALGLPLTDVSCTGAETEDMTAPQRGLMLGGTNPAQFDALTPATTLVTVGIGGNDAGLVSVGLKCGELGSRDPMGRSCREHYTAGGTDQVGARIDEAAPKVAAVLRGIHLRAPGARVAIVGYPAVAPTDGTGCYPAVPASPDDLAYINELLVRINTMIAQQASANDAEFVDTYTDSIGHDVCRLPTVRWFEGLAPTAPAYPLHPNAEGEASMARSTIKVLRGPRPAATAPAITGFAQARRARRVGPPPRFTFTLDRDAAVRMTLNYRVADKRYGPTKPIAERTLAAGRHSVRIPRKVLGRRAGAYKITVRPTAGGAEGRPVALRFRIAEAKRGRSRR